MKFNRNDQFVATTTGAITGAFVSGGMSQFLSKSISSKIFSTVGFFKGLASNILGGSLSSIVEEFEEGDSWNTGSRHPGRRGGRNQKTKVSTKLLKPLTVLAPPAGLEPATL